MENDPFERYVWSSFSWKQQQLPASTQARMALHATPVRNSSCPLPLPSPPQKQAGAPKQNQSPYLQEGPGRRGQRAAIFTESSSAKRVIPLRICLAPSPLRLRCACPWRVLQMRSRTQLCTQRGRGAARCDGVRTLIFFPLFTLALQISYPAVIQGGGGGEVEPRLEQAPVQQQPGRAGNVFVTTYDLNYGQPQARDYKSRRYKQIYGADLRQNLHNEEQEQQKQQLRMVEYQRALQLQIEEKKRVKEQLEY